MKCANYCIFPACFFAEYNFCIIFRKTQAKNESCRPMLFKGWKYQWFAFHNFCCLLQKSVFCTNLRGEKYKKIRNNAHYFLNVVLMQNVSLWRKLHHPKKKKFGDCILTFFYTINNYKIQGGWKWNECFCQGYDFRFWTLYQLTKSNYIWLFWSMKRVSLQAYLVHLKVSSLHIFSEVEVNSLNVLPMLCNIEQVRASRPKKRQNVWLKSCRDLSLTIVQISINFSKLSLGQVRTQTILTYLWRKATLIVVWWQPFCNKFQSINLVVLSCFEGLCKWVQDS